MRGSRPLLAALFAASLPACTSDEVVAPTSAPAVDPREASWLHVEDGRVFDAHGRERVLRGVNAKIDGLFDVKFDDGRMPNEIVPPLDKTDGPEMARLGFDLVRLCVSWSGLEPTEGAFSDDYFKLLDKVIDGFTDAGLHVLIDFHEDAWSKEIGEDGAPAWAIVPAPPKLLSGPVYEGPGLDCPCDSLDGRRTSAPVMDAFASFFQNTQQIQDRFLPVWKQVVGRYANRPGVVGFEAMNEPVAFQVTGGQALLESFHRKALAAMRAAEAQAAKLEEAGAIQPHAYFLEPDVMARRLTTLQRASAPLGDANVVYAPHLYGVQTSGSTAAEIAASIAPTFADMRAEADAWGGALAIGEWATGLDDPKQRPSIDGIHAAAADANLGLVLWSWKGYGAKSQTSGFGAPYQWSYAKGAFAETQPGVSYLSRPYPVAVPGRLASHKFDPDTNVLEVRFTSTGGEAAPVVYLPAPRFPDGVAVSLDGEDVLVPIDRLTQRGVVPWHGQAGAHVLVARPRP